MIPDQRSILAFSLVFFVALLVVLSGTEFKAYGCSCTMPNKCEAFGSASAVFIGRAVGGTEREEKKDHNGNTVVFLRGMIHFAVEQVFSGINGREVDVDFGTNSTCGYSGFKQGKSYLVYASGDQKKGLSTGKCSRTIPLASAEAKEDLEYLRNLPPIGSGARIYGNVYTRPLSQGRYTKRVGFAEIKVTATDSQGRVFDTLSDDNGDYELKGLTPGDYKIEACLPEDYHKKGSKQRVTDRCYAKVDFIANFDGSVSGSVIGPDDRPFLYGFVKLISVDEAGKRGHFIESGLINSQGYFTIKEIPPGRYWLGINIADPPTEKIPYPSTWYPGVTDKTQATIIELGRAQKLSGYTLKLPRKLTMTKRRVQGTVYWPDGTPAAGAQVYLDTDDIRACLSGCLSTDANGKFDLTSYEGMKYRVMAFGYTKSRPSIQVGAEPVVLDLNEDITGIRLVLTVDIKTWGERYLKY